MNNDVTFTEKLAKIVNNPFVVLLTYLLSIVSFFNISIDNLLICLIFRSFIALYLILLTFFICRRYFSIKRFKNNLVAKINSDSAEINKLLLQFTKTVIESSLKVRKKKNIDYDHFKSIVKNICSLIQKIICKISGQEFSVCIKIFSLNELLETDYANMSTVTIARESKDFIERSAHDHQKQSIATNTSFKSLLATGDLLWSCPDLTKLDPEKIKGSSYQNPDNNYRNFYKSTTVTPIRTKIENVDRNIIDYSNNCDRVEYHYLGFLCIDSCQTFKEDEAFFEQLFPILILMGDALYPLLENYLINKIERV